MASHMPRVDSRYVRLRCPLCHATSPTCDQRKDVRRDTLSKWWVPHLADHNPSPIVEVVRDWPAGNEC